MALRSRETIFRSFSWYANRLAGHWEIGRRIVKFEQGGADRATYGDALVDGWPRILRSASVEGSAARTSGKCGGGA
jgi:hypothetical protein